MQDLAHGRAREMLPGQMEVQHWHPVSQIHRAPQACPKSEKHRLSARRSAAGWGTRGREDGRDPCTRATVGSDSGGHRRPGSTQAAQGKAPPSAPWPGGRPVSLLPSATATGEIPSTRRAAAGRKGASGGPAVTTSLRKGPPRRKRQRPGPPGAPRVTARKTPPPGTTSPECKHHLTNKHREEPSQTPTEMRKVGQGTGGAQVRVGCV